MFFLSLDDRLSQLTCLTDVGTALTVVPFLHRKGVELTDGGTGGPVQRRRLLHDRPAHQLGLCA